MAKKKIKKAPSKIPQNRSVVMSPVSLPARLQELIQVPTPIEFIKTRPGKGGRTFRYIEGGYVIAQLNKIFSPIGWDFDIVREKVYDKEVVVRGRLEIKDFKSGYSVGRTRTGTKERIAGVPLGDTIKSAETDALKKCASHFGIGLDVYWQQMEDNRPTEKSGARKPSTPPKKETPTKISKAKVFEMSLKKIVEEDDVTVLAQYRERIDDSDIYSAIQKKSLIKAIANKLKENVAKNS